MMNSNLPVDDHGNTMQITPQGVALARTQNNSLSSTRDVALNAKTTFLRLYATGQDVYLKWGTDPCTSSNFDEVIPVGQVVDLVIPNQLNGSPFTHINLIERAASGAIVIIEK